MESRPRVAVCYAGQLRSATCRFAPGSTNPSLGALDSIQRHVIEPLRAYAQAVEVFTALDAPPRAHQRVPGRMMEPLRRILNTLRPTQGVLIGEVSCERRAAREPLDPRRGAPYTMILYIYMSILTTCTCARCMLTSTITVALSRARNPAPLAG